MLDYIVNSKRDPEFEQPLVLMPTAINYDRVLEDRNLTEELMGREDRSTKIEKLNTTLEFLFKNLVRSFVKRFKRYGYAIVTFGTPIIVDDFIREHPSLMAETFEERKEALNALAELVMSEISRALPLTPVTLTAPVVAFSSGLVQFQKIDGAYPLSVSSHFPILLTPAASLSPDAQAAMQDLAIKTVLVLGGTNAVSQSVQDSVASMGITVKRIAGPTLH